MTRDELLSLYRSIRMSIRRILRAAPKACSRSDLTRAAKQLGLWSAEGIVLDDDDETLEMLVDIALFEPNQRGRLAFETFYLRQGQQLDAADRLLAGRMTAAVFSLFRHAGKHDVAGIWLEDLLDQDRRLWLMDEALEQSGRAGMVFGMRLFDSNCSPPCSGGLHNSLSGQRGL